MTTFSSYSNPTEMELNNTATFFVQAFADVSPLVLSDADLVLTDPSGATHTPTETLTTDGSPSSAPWLMDSVGLWSWVWTVTPASGPTGTTSGTITVRDNTGN